MDKIAHRQEGVEFFCDINRENMVWVIPREHNLDNTHLQKNRQVGIIASKGKFSLVNK